MQKGRTMSEKAWLIPNDWDGESWQDLCLSWPASPKWSAVLVGLIDLMTRGRSWDRSTGSIKDTQAIGQEIFDRFLEWRSCTDGDTVQPDPDTVYVYLGDSQGCEDEEMGCNCCFEYQDGILMQLVCGRWQPVPGAQGDVPAYDDGTDPSDPNDEVPGDDENVNQDVKCRVAWMIANAMWEVHAKIMDYVDDVLPIPIIGHLVAAALPQYTLSKSHISQAVSLIVTTTVGLDLDIVFGSETNQEPDLASWMMRFLPESYSISSLDYNKTALGLELYSFHEGIEINLGQFAEGPYWEHIFRALGRGTINELAAEARMLPEGSFDCEDNLVIVPDLDQVFFSGSLVDLWKPAGVNKPTLTLNHNKDTATIGLSGTGSLAYTDQQFKLGLSASIEISSITIKFTGRGPTNDWVTPQQPDLTDLQAGTIEGVGTVTKTVVGGSVAEGFITVKFDWPGLAVPTFFGWPSSGVSFRMNPRDIAAPYSYNFVAQILGYETA